ncbi:MAG: inositol monophosphatase, partial [Gammaproteobacteria bacterium]|nr:inositol monophosphatase [Gammaproteobacteria bacterium]
MHAMINIALSAVWSASEALLQSADRLDRLKIINNDPANFVSSIDKEVELTIIYHLQKIYPDHSIETRLGEKIEGEANEPTWLVDPLLGSFNYSRGIDCYGIAVACQIEGTVTHSVLILPSRNEEFIATRGAGAKL